ncbi:MAG TPA: hypothetical protein HPP80_07965 [Rhodospirillaceae bacterium]|nr:hypothetical protein [Rhodospirillaceae bacterium]
MTDPAPTGDAPAAAQTKGKSRARPAKAAQALAGFLTSATGQNALKEDQQLAQQLALLDRGDLERLLRLTAVALTDERSQPAVERVSKRLEENGITLTIHGDHNQVTVNGGGAKDSPGELSRPKWTPRNSAREPPARERIPAYLRNSWGRQVGSRLKGFLGGR